MKNTWLQVRIGDAQKERFLEFAKAAEISLSKLILDAVEQYIDNAEEE